MWLLSLLVPLFAGAGPWLVMETGSTAGLWFPIAVLYGVMPLIDFLLGEDHTNPPEWAVAQLEADPYYRRVTYALVPLLWAMFVFAAWYDARHVVPWHAHLALVMSTGVIGGFGINVGHELGHKRGALDRRLAKLILAPTGYGHFSIEHNRGHHRDVATPLDPASSRMGENIYAFLLREMPGAWVRAWGLEGERLRREGLPVWSIHNEIVHTGLLTVVLWTALSAWLGVGVLPFLLGASFWANFQLTTANYIEHYGLLRAARSPGRYEPCQPRHSWNSNHLFSNWAVFHLQRHADHHAHPLRSYQSLRHFDDAPGLPNGYFGMFLVSYVPPLWFALMDPRLVEVVERDPSRINFDPGQRERLCAKYGLRVQPA
jgi:alkane 1-monooxygenase